MRRVTLHVVSPSPRWGSGSRRHAVNHGRRPPGGRRLTRCGRSHAAEQTRCRARRRCCPALRTPLRTRPTQGHPTPPAAPDAAAARLYGVEPEVVDPLGGSTLHVSGTGFGGRATVRAVRVGGVKGGAAVRACRCRRRAGRGDGGRRARRGARPGGGIGDAVLASSPGRSPPGAPPRSRALGSGRRPRGWSSTSRTTYEWQRLTPNIGDAWRARWQHAQLAARDR